MSQPRCSNVVAYTQLFFKVQCGHIYVYLFFFSSQPPPKIVAHALSTLHHAEETNAQAAKQKIPKHHYHCIDLLFLSSAS